jgi:type IV pilus assembly protein PilV
MNTRAPSQRGVMLVEVMIALLIFALGVLGLVGLQATAVQQSGQTKYRTDATLLANELVGQMWTQTDRSFANLSAKFTSSGAGGSAYKSWKDRVTTELPGAASYPPLVQFVQIQPLDGIKGAASAPASADLVPTSRVSITLYWKAPTDKAGDPPRQFVQITEIRS